MFFLLFLFYFILFYLPTISFHLLCLLLQLGWLLESITIITKDYPHNDDGNLFFLVATILLTHATHWKKKRESIIVSLSLMVGAKIFQLRKDPKNYSTVDHLCLVHSSCVLTLVKYFKFCYKCSFSFLILFSYLWFWMYLRLKMN